MAIGYRCEGSNCGVVRAERWTGPCPGCGGYYNCKRTASADGTDHGPPPRGQVTAFSDISPASKERISCGFAGADRVLGIDPITKLHGIAAKGGQAIQLYGSPGGGKSTLLLQMCLALTRARYGVLYIAGEETLDQIKDRGDRIGTFNHKMQIVDENDLDAILYAIDDAAPDVAIVDSMNTVSVEDYLQGSTSAMKIATREIYKMTHSRGIGLIIIVQMNKAGDDFSGPKELEHTIDTSLEFLTMPNGLRRLCCANKNRFGRTPAEQYFSMNDNGIFAECDPPAPKQEPSPSEPTTPPQPPHLVSVP